MSDGSRHAIVKRILEVYRKAKADLVDFVLEYQGSLDEFLNYAREHYPALEF
jgi:hypothetical protein